MRTTLLLLAFGSLLWIAGYLIHEAKDASEDDDDPNVRHRPWDKN